MPSGDLSDDAVWVGGPIEGLEVGVVLLEVASRPGGGPASGRRRVAGAVG
jgi:hypothetical protein